jgi:ATP-dependent DNA helicase RecG
LKFDEAWVVQVVLSQRRHEVSAMAAKPWPAATDGLVAALTDRLPYPLTKGQCEVIEQIDQDLAQPHPMHRLLQGEVGSGKTVVALHAMLRVIESGGQAALLAPTEVLAEQHLRSIRSLLGPLALGGMLGGEQASTRVDLLTGSSTARERRRALAGAAGGETGILVGTHALLRDPVQFAELALVVVDEQHRFGVEQRAALSEKAASGQRPHVLVMTATPIPRTIAMTVFGDLSVSTLRELPAGRSPIVTHVVPAEKPAYQQRMWQRIAEEVQQGRQAYVVCPRIDATDHDTDLAGAPADDAAGSGWSGVTSVTELAQRLAEGELSGVRVGVLHGRMPAEDKEAVMRRFSEHGSDGIDVLVATTVIEVGVDVPNATVMAVMDAERFGVSQLHQLRGRVGRGGHPGLCLLHTTSAPDSPGRARCEAVAATSDGFQLAEVDLVQRREGDVLGAVQSGRRSSLQLLSVLADAEGIEAARDAADRVVAADPTLAGHPGLARVVADWTSQDRLDYVDKG